MTFLITNSASDNSVISETQKQICPLKPGLVGRCLFEPGEVIPMVNEVSGAGVGAGIIWRAICRLVLAEVGGVTCKIC